MTRNPILDEIRSAREKLLADAGGDLAVLVAEMRKRQAKSGRKVISGPVAECLETNRCGDIAKSIPNTQ